MSDKRNLTDEEIQALGFLPEWEAIAPKLADDFADDPEAFIALLRACVAAVPVLGSTQTTALQVVQESVCRANEFNYATHVLASIAPTVTPLDTVFGILTQIDNAVTPLSATGGDAAAQVAAIEQAVRESACPHENTEDDDEPYICYNEDADPIVQATTLVEAVEQIIGCWNACGDQLEKALAELVSLRSLAGSTSGESAVRLAREHAELAMTCRRLARHLPSGHMLRERAVALVGRLAPVSPLRADDVRLVAKQRSSPEIVGPRGYRWRLGAHGYPEDYHPEPGAWIEVFARDIWDSVIVPLVREGDAEVRANVAVSPEAGGPLTVEVDGRTVELARSRKLFTGAGLEELAEAAANKGSGASGYFSPQAGETATVEIECTACDDNGWLFGDGTCPGCNGKRAYRVTGPVVAREGDAP